MQRNHLSLDAALAHVSAASGPHSIASTSLKTEHVMVAHTYNSDDAVRAFDKQPGGPAVQPHIDHTGDASPPPAHPHLPAPTYWPAAMAFGITLLVWGIITSLLIVALGLIIIFVALGGWIGDLLDEH